jgi:hypothetical protein
VLFKVDALTYFSVYKCQEEVLLHSYTRYILKSQDVIFLLTEFVKVFYLCRLLGQCRQLAKVPQILPLA